MQDNKRKYYLSSLAFAIDKTARVWELLVRHYYKEYIKDKKSILELDEFITLIFIKLHPAATQSEISKELLKGKAHIGKILTNMESKGYVQRQVVIEKNIMAKRSLITPFGLELIEITEKAFSELAEEVSNVFSDEEVSLLNSLLEKYRTNMLNNFKIQF